MDIELVLASWSLQRIWGEQLPGIAIDLMAAGFDCPSLPELAIDNKPTTLRDGGPIFARCLEELGLELPTPEVAAMRLARFYAEEIVSGRITPVAGAEEIWEIAREVNIEIFAPFAWPESENEIIENAKHLLVKS